MASASVRASNMMAIDQGPSHPSCEQQDKDRQRRKDQSGRHDGGPGVSAVNEGVEQRESQNDGIPDHMKPGRRQRANMAVAQEVDEAGNCRQSSRQETEE